MCDKTQQREIIENVKNNTHKFRKDNITLIPKCILYIFTIYYSFISDFLTVQLISLLEIRFLLFNLK